MRLEVLCGMIGSGKTTYARRRAAEGALVFSNDSLIQMLHGEYRYEPGLRDCYRTMEEDLVRIALHFGRDVVVDRTHLAREARERWVGFAHYRLERPGLITPLRPEVIAVAFPIESAEVHARRRFEADPRGRPYEEWLLVARHHADQAALEPLGDDEGFDRIIRDPAVVRPPIREGD